MWRYILALPLLAHGFAHVSGILASWTLNGVGYNKKNPWVFSSGILIDNPVGRAFGLLWFIAVIGLVGSGLALVFRQSWWWQLAIAASAVSLAVIITWWNSVPPGAKLGAVFDILVILFPLSPLRYRLFELIK